MVRAERGTVLVETDDGDSEAEPASLLLRLATARVPLTVERFQANGRTIGEKRSAGDFHSHRIRECVKRSDIASSGFHGDHGITVHIGHQRQLGLVQLGVPAQLFQNHAQVLFLHAIVFHSEFAIGIFARDSWSCRNG